MKIGFLPLYIKLYDDMGTKREAMETFYAESAELFRKKGLEVVTTDFCRIKPEFEKAIEKFENENVDAIVTWHAAYSPSLESIYALLKTELPIIVFDSTPAPEYKFQDSGLIGANHGIHGVMDMCSMLTRYGKPYAIAAGHHIESDCIDRVCAFVRSAIAAKKLSSMKVGLIGGGFDGMGDFAVEPEELKNLFGITVENIAPESIAAEREAVTNEEIQSEIAYDKENYDFDDTVIEDEYKEYMRSCVALRKLIEKVGYTAFSVNFLNVDGLNTMPFTECCKAMERGVGYAGEGDALTAAFTGAFLSAYPETSFVEIFCPDWRSNKVLLSHMGEMNYRVADTKPLIHRTGSKFIKGTMPYAGYSKMKGGKGVYVNISRLNDGYQMLITPAEILSVKEDNMPTTIRGWMRSENSKSTAEFLEKLSKNGATHHSSFIYGASVEEIEYFANLLQIKTVVI